VESVLMSLHRMLRVVKASQAGNEAPAPGAPGAETH
jgi:hypothetical protein